SAPSPGENFSLDIPFYRIATNAWHSSLRLSSQGRPLPTLQVLRPQWARWFDLVLRSFNVRQDFGQRHAGIRRLLHVNVQAGLYVGYEFAESERYSTTSPLARNFPITTLTRSPRFTCLPLFEKA